MPDQYNKLVGYTSKYPYLVAIRTDSGNFGTGILISPRFVLTCGHVLQDSAWIEVISKEGSTSARTQNIDESLDLALLELTRPISAPKVKFTDYPLQPGLALVAVGVQATPGQQDTVSVAEVKLTFRNKNDADGKILDMQLEGGARPGYSGGPIVVEKGTALLCVGVMRSGGQGANTTYAIGPASIRAFVEEYIPDMWEGKSPVVPERIRRLLIFNGFLFGVFAIGAITGWHYLASHSPTVPSGPVIVVEHEPDNPASGRPAPSKKSSQPSPQGSGARLNLKTKDYAPLTDAAPTATTELHSAQAPDGSSDPKSPVPHQTLGDGVDQGKVMVWVNTSSKVYHCPGSRYYVKKTKHGEYMTQAEAQAKGNRPADWKVCTVADGSKSR